MAKNRKEQEDQDDVADETRDPKGAPDDDDDDDDEKSDDDDDDDDEKSDDDDEDKEEEDEQDDEESDEEGDDEDDDQSDEQEAKVEEPDRSRVKLWIVLGVAIVIAAILLMKREESPEGGQPSAAVGTTVSGDLTLVTADRNDLDCLAEKGVQNYQCGYVDEKTPRQVQDGEKLRPFMTVDRRLYLIPGLFLETAIAERYKTEQPNKPRDQLRRFTAKCKLKIAGELDSVKLRWSPGGTWEPPKKFPVATVSECKVEG